MTNVQKTRANNLKVTFNNPEEQQKFEELIRSDPIDGATLRSSASKNVHFALRGIPADYDATSLGSELQELNHDHPYIRAETLNVKDARLVAENMVDDRKFKTFKLTASLKCAKLILDNPSFYIGLRRVKATVWKPNFRCTKCLERGHNAADCTAKLVCKHCSQEHLSYKCNDKKDETKFRCQICFKERKSHRHRADVETCPILSAEVSDAVNKTIAAILANHG